MPCVGDLPGVVAVPDSSLLLLLPATCLEGYLLHCLPFSIPLPTP